MSFTDAINERWVEEGLEYQFKQVPKDARESFYVPNDPKRPYNSGGKYIQSGFEHVIYVEDILGPNWLYYKGLLPKWYQWGPWKEKGPPVIRWVPKEHPLNADENIRERVWYLMCPAALNLTSLSMDFTDAGMVLYQQHRPFRENTSTVMPTDSKDVKKCLDNVVRSIRGLERVKEFAEPYLVQINDAITGFRQQVNKIKIKNSLINEREKPKFKQ